MCHLLIDLYDISEKEIKSSQKIWKKKKTLLPIHLDGEIQWNVAVFNHSGSSVVVGNGVIVW